MSTDCKAWKENLSKYQNASLVKNEVQSVLKLYKELRAHFENFTFNDGRSADLLCLEGTIPVLYHSVIYHIPIAVFLYENHPHKAPIVYVRPTSKMRIKPSDFVDITGLVTPPYLSDWSHPDSDLTGLLGVLQTIFGQCSPVFSKDPAPTPQPPPTSSHPCPMPMPTPMFYPQPPLMPGGPPLPQPPGIGWQIPGMGPIQMPQLPNYGPAFPELPPLIQNSVPNLTPNRTGTISEDHLLLSLRSAVGDKIRRVQNELICQYGDELKAIQQAHSDLQSGSQRLQQMLTHMTHEQTTAATTLDMLTKRNNELSDLVQRLSAAENEPINVDDAVNTTYPVYRQLLSSFAEEQAIEDAIYYLGSALGKGVLDLDVFLKKVRELSRRQFMLRATVQLCREKAGLPVT